MPDPVIIPTTPTVVQPNQTTGPVDTSPGMEQVQRAFDRAYPDLTPKKPASQEPQKPPQAPTAPITEPQTPSTPAAESSTESTQKADEAHKIPSFLEEALRLDTPLERKAPVAEPDEEWPEELPQEERKSRIKGLREAYKKVKGELAEARKEPHRDPREQQRLQWLEQQNKQMAEVLSRVGVEHSAEFQQNIMAPLNASWREAAKIVRDAGGDPQSLAKAMSLQGRAQFEALDALFQEMPESAKMEAHDALRNYRRYEEIRRNAMQNAPKALEAIRERETQRQYQEVTKQRQDMQGMFERALSTLRDKARVEVFQQTDDPEGKWWNEQSARVIEQGKNLFLENTDMDKVALACLLAPAADAYRKLFIKSQQRVTALEKMFKERIGSEPNLSESAGTSASLAPEAMMKEDLKKPFVDVFLREFHKSQARR